MKYIKECHSKFYFNLLYLFKQIDIKNKKIKLNYTVFKILMINHIKYIDNEKNNVNEIF